jgi:IS605 OrfB family transposase
MNELVLTFQTRLKLNKDGDEILQECASLLTTVEHCLYAEVAKGKTSVSCKNEFLKQFDITARQFNACRVNLEGKIAACQAGQESAIISLRQQIKKLEQKIKLLEKKSSKRFILHQKKRRKFNLQKRLEAFEDDKKHKRVRLCFGGKKLFNAQFHLEKNGFKSHAEWKEAWKAKRKSEFFLLGSKDETSGNQSCTATLQSDGKLSLRLRLPKQLEAIHGKYLLLKNLSFTHGHNEILLALSQKQAISYRFKKDHKSWRVFVSTTIPKEKPVSLEGNGAIGLDLNADHIAYVETDRFGNPIEKKKFSWSSYGKTKEQLKALTGNICKEIISLAQQAKKPIVVEKLDFQKKKILLSESNNKKYARMLSSFSYSLFFTFLNVRAFKNGITIHQVNPAFTSIIGCVNYAARYDLSIHLAAALCIARRYLNLSEAPCSSERKIPDGKGSHVAFVLPARNRTKHVWHFWGQVKRKLSTVYAAHKRARNRSKSPLSPAFETVNSS